MNPDYVIGIFSKLLETTALIAAPLLAAGLVVGVVVGIVQAVTQIHEPSLTFVPKALVFALLLLYMGPWFIERLIGFTNTVAGEMVMVGRRAR